MLTDRNKHVVAFNGFHLNNSKKNRNDYPRFSWKEKIKFKKH